MLKVTLWHEPVYFAFYVQDPSTRDRLGPTVADDLLRQRFAARSSTVAVGVISEYTSIPITVEYDTLGPDPVDQAQWDRIVECSVETKAKALCFESTTGDEFGRLDVSPGNYRLRIHYGGQEIRKPGGETGDFYLIQVWPSSDTSSRTLKP